jgi:hypothetical protein
MLDASSHVWVVEVNEPATKSVEQPSLCSFYFVPREGLLCNHCCIVWSGVTELYPDLKSQYQGLPQFPLILCGFDIRASGIPDDIWKQPPVSCFSNVRIVHCVISTEDCSTLYSNWRLFYAVIPSCCKHEHETHCRNEPCECSSRTDRPMECPEKTGEPVRHR